MANLGYIHSKTKQRQQNRGSPARMIGKVEADGGGGWGGRCEVLLAELGGQTEYLLVKCGMA